jgi:hypothetical protein
MRQARRQHDKSLRLQNGQRHPGTADQNAGGGLPGLARFWTQALGWKVFSERENEIVIGTDENAPVGMCFMPVTDPKTVKAETGGANRSEPERAGDPVISLGTRGSVR